MSAAPTVSVVIPTYNRARTLGRAIRSVLRQSLAELELIVVDDGSTDDTPAVLATFSDPRLRLIRRSNGGAAAARNSGVAAATGEFIAFQDSDDEWLLDKLERQVAALRGADPAIGLALCGLVRWDGLEPHYVPNPANHAARQPDIRPAILRQNYALTSGWVVRRRHFLEVGAFDETLPPLEDWEWLIRYTARFGSILVDEPLAVIYESPDSISGNPERYVRAMEGIIAKHGESLAPMPQALSNLHYVAGKKCALHGDVVDARRHYRRALRLHPADWRTWAALGLSFGGQGLFRSVWRGVRRAKGYRVGGP
jgi:glycosyltransferase involved in cell wall biosynthesis